MSDGFLFDDIGPVHPEMWKYLESRVHFPVPPTMKGHTLYYCGGCHALVAVVQSGYLCCDCGGRYFRPVKSQQWTPSEWDKDFLGTFCISPK